MIKGTVTAALAFIVVCLVAYCSASQIQMNVPDSTPGTVVALEPPMCRNVEHIQEEVTRQIERAKNCQSDADCVIESFGCPFGCFTSVNANKVDAIHELIGAIPNECSTCQYRCRNIDPIAVCQEGKCEVVTVTTSLLAPPPTVLER